MRRGPGTLLACALLGLPAGAVWLWWAEPARWMLSPSGFVMSEELVVGQFDVFGTFVVIGAVVGFVVGLACALVWHPISWRGVVGTIPASLAAAVVTWQVGVRLGPAPVPSAEGLQIGQTVPAAFSLDSPVAFLVWPAASLFVVACWTWFSEDD